MGAWTEIVDYTVPSNTTSVVLNDFGTITKDDFYKMVVTFQNGTGGSTDSNYFLHVNGNTTAGDYRHQRLRGFSSSTAADRSDNALIGFTQRDSGAEKGQSFIYFKLTENDYFTHFANNNIDDTGANLQLQFIYSTSEVTFTSGVTSLTITASATNGLGTDSRIQIYRLDAEKVADITVASNTTQVDISSLSIGKDSEYLLVSDVVSTADASYELFVNDNTTATNYYHQRILATGTTASAERRNNAQIGFAGASLVYSFIKLSEIGAYTSQNYETTPGSTGIVLTNRFVSSTAENITSITKLNLKNTTDGFRTGNRFILYKLK
jgi:hypothetical protein